MASARQKIFDYMNKYGHEEIIFCNDRAANLRAIIAIHDTSLGPAVGGTRRWAYENEEAALEDALRLSRAMTYKLAASGCNAGGGKIVMLVESQDHKSEAMYRSLGRFIESLKGRFFTGPDVGTSTQDLAYMRVETKYVSGFPDEAVGKLRPGVVAARGVLQGIRACVNEVFESETLSGMKICVQGLGEVGYVLVSELHREADVTVTDIDAVKVERAVNEFGVKAVGHEEIYDVECDVFSPCALGGILNDDTIPRLKCKIVAGAANNQLLEDKHGDMLHQRGILYAPDFVINAGGIAYALDSVERGAFNAASAESKMMRTYDQIAKVIEISKRDSIPTYKAAEALAEERIKAIKNMRRIESKDYTQFIMG